MHAQLHDSFTGLAVQVFDSLLQYGPAAGNNVSFTHILFASKLIFI